ncbi:methionine--tRNA ligase [Mycoplasma sp. CAG:611]|jgi:methionyl-tRNA synthetase|nr:MAG: methionine--tRNA ligase [Mycoplasma sp. CAG:611_25_7]CDA23576.1 methionine--tRNA ligase [Mycoplasma sp. CAG:611]
MKEKYYITTPIYYPSANFHIGHCYTTIIADSIARYQRLKEKDVFFLTGTDEHGQKIENKAKEKGVTPKEYVDEIVENAKDLWKSLGISYDKFIRTTDEYHEKAVQKIFDKLYEQGDIYLDKYKGLYCTPCESFWTETQLVDGKCPDCGREVSLVEEESYFFRLSKYQKRIEELYKTNPEFIKPESRKNEMINNFLKPGLEDLCVSRTTFSWGIPVSFNPKHVIYVWIDALTNYITALGYLSDDDSLFKKYWPADLHLVGKEIVRFHAIIWPALLMALDLPLPKQVFGHGWLKIDGGKISKSLGNYKDPREYIDKYGVDAVRYYALREVSFGSDGNFSEEALIARTNADLANTLGNLLNRTIAMTNKYFDGVISNSKVNEEIDTELINKASNLKSVVDKNMEKLYISDALEEIFNFLRECNKYIDDTTPWVLAKEEKLERLQTVLYNLLESIRISSVLLTPFMPTTTEKIFKQLNTNLNTYDTLNEFGALENNHKLGQIEVLFKRIEIEK